MTTGGRVVGRYEILDAIAEGGMASVHIGKMIGGAGFARAVAIKRLLAHNAQDPDFVAMLLDEARVVSRIRHPNVVPVLDVLVEGNEVLVVMDYVEGESFARLLRHDASVPVSVVLGIMTNVLHGLHAAHECVGEDHEPLGVVHRDVSPQNILVSTDGLARILDFGIAKVARSGSEPRGNQVKGKLAYMAPEQIHGREVDRRTDVYGASVVLWEALAGRRLFAAKDTAEIISRVLMDEVRPPSAVNPRVPAALDGIVMKGLARDPNSRYASARDMALAIERTCIAIAPPWQIGEWAHGLEQSSAPLSARFRAARALGSDVSAFGSGPLPLRAPSSPSHPTISGERDREPSISSIAPATTTTAHDSTPPVSTAQASTPRATLRRERAMLGAVALALLVGLGSGLLLARPHAVAPAGAPAAPSSATPAAPPPPIEPAVEPPAAPPSSAIIMLDDLPTSPQPSASPRRKPSHRPKATTDAPNAPPAATIDFGY